MCAISTAAKRLGERADLVHLYQYRVRNAFGDSLLQPLRVGDEEIITHQLAPVAERRGQVLPACPVVFGHAVLNRDDGKGVDQVRQELHLCVARELPVSTFIDIASALEEFRRCAIKRQADILSRTRSRRFRWI